MLYKIRNFLFGSKLKRAVNGKETILDRILDWCSEKYTDFIIVPYETIGRFLYWGWKLRHNYSWDCNSLYFMIYLKTKSLIDYSRKYAHLCWNSKEDGKEFRKLKIASELAKRLWESDYNRNQNIHIEKWGDLQWESIKKENSNFSTLNLYRKNANTEELNKQEWKEHTIAIKADEQQRNNEKRYLYKLLEKHLESWWD